MNQQATFLFCKFHTRLEIMQNEPLESEAAIN